jgi:Inhibitor of the KinA pathway to sporulation, predicted exonuclease
MNYIVLDLEWNQCPSGKENMNPSLPFEIIEIGAVKLNSKMEIIDKFSAVIKPQVYKEIHFKTMEIIHIEPKKLEKAQNFSCIATAFLKWCESESVFCTWGPSDLSVLQSNLKYYNLDHLLIGPLIYYDIQKIFSILYEDRKTRRNLEFAVDYFSIENKGLFHQAYYDAYYTAKILMEFDKEEVKKHYSIDYYKNPKNRREEIYIIYESYSKFISKEFASKESAMKDRKVTSTKCYKCNRQAKKKYYWFSGNNNIYYSLALCEEHGLLKGKIKIKKSEDGKFFAVKIIKQISLEESQIIKAKKDMGRLKRKSRRNLH